MDESTKVNRKERKREKEIDVSVIGEKMKIREKGIRFDHGSGKLLFGS
jgi:hypothetical protein